ncbi:hypothetical protein EBU91_03760 [bacterium]|nr:hypothetical protein [bacterium]
MITEKKLRFVKQVKLYKNGLYGWHIYGTFETMSSCARFLKVSVSVLCKHVSGKQLCPRLLIYKYEVNEVAMQRQSKSDEKKRIQKYDLRKIMEVSKNNPNSTKQKAIQKLLEYAVVKNGDTIENIELKLWTYTHSTLIKVLKEFANDNSTIYNFKDFNLFEKYAKS